MLFYTCVIYVIPMYYELFTFYGCAIKNYEIYDYKEIRLINGTNFINTMRFI